MYGVTVQSGPVPVLGRATALFSNKTYMPAAHTGVDYDVAPDGRFLMIKRLGIAGDEPTNATITVVTHWTDELRAKVK